MLRSYQFVPLHDVSLFVLDIHDLSSQQCVGLIFFSTLSKILEFYLSSPLIKAWIETRLFSKRSEDNEKQFIFAYIPVRLISSL